jgi:hypothetical protein
VRLSIRVCVYLCAHFCHCVRICISMFVCVRICNSARLCSSIKNHVCLCTWQPVCARLYISASSLCAQADLDRDKVFKRLGHFLAFNMQVPRMQKIVDPLVVSIVGLCSTRKQATPASV